MKSSWFPLYKTLHSADISYNMLPCMKEGTTLSQKEFKYDLTIGMIVKNEIKYLRRCLETLAPLRQAISCELIITDTGSTDGTKEIAQEFADVYLEFEWCNDFAKARNTGVERAQGRWFFYVDADNHFDESILEIAQFLQQPQVHQSYDHANLIIRSYSDTEDNLTAYVDTPKPWLLNFSQGRRFFHYPIHETIFIDGEKSGSVSTVMHHWGYLKEVVQSKKERNLPLLRQLLKTSPKDLKARYQLLCELTNPKEKKKLFEESIKIGLPLTKQAEECQIWVMLLRMHYFQFLQFHEEWDALDKLLPSWVDYIPNSIFTLDFLGFCLDYYLKRGKVYASKIDETFPLYQTLFLEQQQHPQVKYFGFKRFPYASLSHYANLETTLLQRAFFEENHPKAKELLSKAKGFTYASPQKKHPFTMAYCNFAFLLEDYVFLTHLVDFMQEEGRVEEKEQLEEALTQKFQSFSPSEQQTFLQAFHPKDQRWSQTFLPPDVTPLPDVTVLKETLLALLMEKRLEDAKPLFLLLQQVAPHDPSLASLSPLFSSTNL